MWHFCSTLQYSNASRYEHTNIWVFWDMCQSLDDFLLWDMSWILRYKWVSVKHLLVDTAGAKLWEYFHLQYTYSSRSGSCVVSFFAVILQNSFRDTMSPKKVSVKSSGKKPKCMISLEVKWEIIKKYMRKAYE